MADFCTKCHEAMFGEGKPDIDVEKIFNSLTVNNHMPVICEGCEMTTIANINGVLKVRNRDMPTGVFFNYREYWDIYNQVTPDGYNPLEGIFGLEDDLPY